MKIRGQGRKLYQSVFNIQYLKLILLMFPLFLEIPMLMPILNTYLKITLVWSASFLIYDFFHQRYFLKGRGKILLCVFLISYFISVVLNYKTSFQMNLIGYFYIVTQVLILTIPSDLDETFFQKVAKYVSKAGMFFSTIGVCLFLAQIEDALLFNGKYYPIGFYSSRLVGVYRNITSPSLAFVTLFSLYYILFQKSKEKNPSILSYYALFINFVHLVLSNSKGVLIGTRVFLSVFVALSIMLSQRKKSRLEKRGFTIAAVIASLFLYQLTINFSQQMLSYAPAYFSEKYQFRSNIEDLDFESVEGPIDLDREAPEHYDKLTGRPLLWKQGFEAFKEKPLFGHGAYSKSGEIGFDFSQQRFTTYHNLYIHTLFSSGLVGFISLMAYFLFLVYITFKNLSRVKTLNSSRKLTFIFTVSILAMSAVIGMGETNILYMNRFHEYVFWYHVGILISYDTVLNYKGELRNA